MFARASKRTLPHDASQSFFYTENLQLPFLCPALYNYSGSTHTPSSVTRTRSRRTAHQSRAKVGKHAAPNGSSQYRTLASAAAPIYPLQHDDFVPWERPPSSSYERPYNVDDGHSITALRPFDPGTSPVIIKDSLVTHPQKFRANKEGISGNVNEIHQTLHACLQVGRLERAAVLVRRLNDIYRHDAPGLLAAHNDYLSELSHRVAQNKDQGLLQNLQRWFEVEMLGAGVKPNETTYAIMIRAGLHRSGASKYRTIKRYITFAEEAGMREETESLLSLYDDVHLDMLLHPQLADGEFSYSGKNTDPTLPAVEVDNSSRAVDELREAESKGAGLTMLKKSLSSFAKNGLMPISDPEISATERQKSLEANTVQAAIDRWREEDAHLRSMGLSSRLASSELGAMMWSWHEKLVPLIKDDIQKSQGLERKEGKNLTSTDKEFLAWGPHLQALSPEMASAVTILVAMKTCSTDPLDDKGVRIHNLVAAVGEAVQSESMVQAIRASTVGNRKPISTYFNKNRLRVSASSERNHLEWNTSLKVKLGAALVAHLLEIAKVNVAKHNPKTGLEVRESQPVFFHTYLYIAGKRIGVVRLNSVVLEKMSKMPVASALAKYLPMLCEPKPWVGYSEGGFLEYPAPVIRLPFGDKQAKRYAVAATENGDMTQVFAGLDVLGKTPWNINRFVFEVMLQVWNSGKAMAKIPPEHPPNDFPPEPASSHDNYKERSLWMKLMRESENRRSALRSQRCFLNFQLEVARAYLDETFYFPHNCDFRGRAYPMIPFLNHMGSDNVRGLLVFGEGKELTANGLWWLKVHLANVYGFDKASFAERLEFTETHVREIRDSVDNPLDGSQWWLQAEDPWQCLAACKELVNALDLPDPTKYISKLAIHQDGTCNGLQHYAALGGDAAGAQQVNLEPGERPSDIYTGVAMLVKAEISKDAAQGNALAKELDGKVTRKVVKQTVMTNVYGVTFQGARQQVRKQLNDLLVGFPDSEELNLHSASGYVAKKIFAALATMFNGAHDIQYWLTDCAGRISESLAPEQMEYIEQASKGMIPPTQFKKIPVGRKSGMGMADFKTTVIWTTPLKMPVVQPYRKITPKRIDTNLQKISIMDRSAADAVDRSKQVQAFPPNFIHSLDATHMFLTALKCNEIGITFAAIHDSFWTHAGDVDTMNNVIRDAFIRMHSEDIVGRLAAEFNTRYKGFMQLVGVKSGSPAGQKIRLWRRQRYMHLRKNEAIKGRTAKDLKSRQIDELLLERQRLKLLASQDHKERREGEQMNTPASVLSWLGDEETLTPTLTSTTVKPASLGLGLSSRNAKLKANQRLDVGNLENGEPVLPALDSGAGTVEDDGVANVSETHSAGKAVDDFQEEDDIEHREAVGSETNELEPSERTKRDRKISVWVPLTFPPVPKKGDFDVTRLKDSQYFFS